MFSTLGKSISAIVLAAVDAGDVSGNMDKAHKEIQALLTSSKSLSGFEPMENFRGASVYTSVGLVFQVNLEKIAKGVRTDVYLTLVYNNDDKGVRVAATADSYINTDETFTVHVGNVTSALCKMSELDTAFDSYYLAKLVQQVDQQVNDFKLATKKSLWSSIVSMFNRATWVA